MPSTSWMRFSPGRRPSASTPIQELAVDELVVGEPLQQGAGSVGILVDHLEDPLEARAVELDQQADDFLNLHTNFGRRDRPKLSEKHLDPVPDLPDVAVTLGHVLPSDTTSPTPLAGRGSQMAPPAASFEPAVPPSLPVQRKDGRRVHPPHDLAVTGPATEVHVHPAGQAWVEGADCPH